GADRQLAGGGQGQALDRALARGGGGGAGRLRVIGIVGGRARGRDGEQERQGDGEQGTLHAAHRNGRETTSRPADRRRCAQCAGCALTAMKRSSSVAETTQGSSSPSPRDSSHARMCVVAGPPAAFARARARSSVPADSRIDVESCTPSTESASR